jgi:hypothetical protein
MGKLLGALFLPGNFGWGEEGECREPRCLGSCLSPARNGACEAVDCLRITPLFRKSGPWSMGFREARYRLMEQLPGQRECRAERDLRDVPCVKLRRR